MHHASIIDRFESIPRRELYFFGLFLVVTGVKMLFSAQSEPDLDGNPVLRFMRKHLRITRDFRGEKLRVVDNGRAAFTPLFVVLVLIAVIDVVFAVDSIPAIFAVTLDPFPAGQFGAVSARPLLRLWHSAEPGAMPNEQA